jgi:alkylation response protein AidB-like acyl-CoA dehydrogenase
LQSYGQRPFATPTTTSFAAKKSGHPAPNIPIETMINHHTTQVFFDGLRIPPDSLIGEEGMGFRYILDGMNVERILIAREVYLQ